MREKRRVERRREDERGEGKEERRGEERRGNKIEEWERKRRRLDTRPYEREI